MDNNDILKEGTSLNNGKYLIVRHLSSGGFGNTYEVVNTALTRLKLAMKEFFIKGDTYRDADSKMVSVSNGNKKELFDSCKAKFKTEAERLCQLKNENIVSIYDFFEENGTAYYVMDYIDGKPLSQLIKEQGHPFSEQQTMLVLSQMLNALDSIHSLNIWHMDIKPQNILMDEHGKCTLIDFGASKHADVDGVVTASTSLAYTPGYAPPEQLSGNKLNWGPWTDIYALGATAFFLLTGKKPPTHDELLNNSVNLFQFPPGVSARLQQVVKSMMTLSFQQRPQNAAQVKRMLSGETSVQGQTIYAGHSTPTVETTVVGSPWQTGQEEVTLVGGGAITSAAGSAQQKQTAQGTSLNKKLIALLVFLLCGVAGVLAYVLLNKEDTKQLAEAETKTEVEQSTSTEDATIEKEVESPTEEDSKETVEPAAVDEPVVEVEEPFADGHYVYQGKWNSDTYPSQSCRVQFTKKGYKLSNCKYTNLRYNVSVPLSGSFDGNTLEFYSNGGKVNMSMTFSAPSYKGASLEGEGTDYDHGDNASLSLRQVR